MDQAQVLHSSLPPPKWPKQQSSKTFPCWSYSFDSCFLQFWQEQHTVMTYACNTAYLPSFFNQMANQSPWGMPLYPGLGGSLRNQLAPKNQAVFPVAVLGARFSLCPKAKAMWPQHHSLEHLWSQVAQR